MLVNSPRGDSEHGYVNNLDFVKSTEENHGIVSAKPISDYPVLN